MTEQPDTTPVGEGGAEAFTPGPDAGVLPVDDSDDEPGNPEAVDTGDLAAVDDADQADTDDEHPANEPVDVSDVIDDGQVLDVTDGA